MKVLKASPRAADMIPTKIDSPATCKLITPIGEESFVFPESDDEEECILDKESTIDPADSVRRARFEGEQSRHASRLEPLELRSFFADNAACIEVTRFVTDIALTPECPT